MVDIFELPPEVAAALQRQHEIDRSEAGQKANISGFVYKGVHIESRWAVQRELDDMQSIVDALSDLTARRMLSIFCDSKAGATYTVEVEDGLWAPIIRDEIEDSIKKVCRGHNGVFIKGAPSDASHISPDWNDEY